MDYSPQYKNQLTGINNLSRQKMSARPIIAPRSHDREVWSFPGYRHSAVNYSSGGYDMSEEYTPIPQADNYVESDPRLSTYTNFTLDSVDSVCSKQYADNTKSKSKSVSFDPVNDDTTPLSQLSSIPEDTTPISAVIPQSKPTAVTQLLRERFVNPPTGNPPASNSNPGNPPVTSMASPMSNPPNTTPISQLTRERLDDRGVNISNRSQTLNNKIITSDYIPVDNYPQLLTSPPSGLLIPKTITSIYGPGEVTSLERTKYLENIQPNQYSYSDVSYPINANLGISYTPGQVPLVLDQVATPIGTYPLFHRIDPQLIRDSGLSAERVGELPRRTQWSARYSNFDAAPGTVNFEDIYDPRFTGYGDGTRSYGDVQLGQVNYYYSDVDAYRSPNFGIRSKVDHMDYVDPMGRVIPEYSRSVGVNDVRQSVHDQYNSDAIYFREDLQERLMRKRNSELWQLRAAPQRKSANNRSSTSVY